MEYSIESFSRCVYNPIKNLRQGAKVMDLYPEFRDRRMLFVKSYGVGIDSDKVLRWMMMLYQPESPLIVDFPDYKIRRTKAGLLCGFDTEEGSSFVDCYQGVINGSNTKVTRGILEFCRLLRNDDYAELKIYQDKLYEMLDRLIVTTEAKDEKLILENVDRLKGRLKELKKKFVVYDEGGDLEYELMNLLDMDYVDMSRESIAKRIENGEDIYGESFVCPYGKDYVKQYYEDTNKKRYEGKL